jgi:N-acetylmuramoyl-L-alanine amidase
MNLRKLILTENACYKAGKTIVPKGIMVHSTGVRPDRALAKAN